MPKLSKNEVGKIGEQYRAGLVSMREIARRFGVSHKAIQKLAMRYSWRRDLAPQIRQAAAKKLSADQATVTYDPVTGRHTSVASRHEVAIDEAVTIDRQSDEIAAIQRIHRNDIRQLAQIGATLAGDLIDAIAHRTSIKDLIFANTDPRDTQKREAMLRAVSLPAQVNTWYALAKAREVLIRLERTAFGVDEQPPTDKEDDWYATLPPPTAAQLARLGLQRIPGSIDEGGGATDS